MKNRNHFEYVGNIHVHSTYSDGALPPSGIAAIGAKVGLDFVILNDHDFMAKELHLEDESFYGSVLLLVGLEIGERYHHYLAFDLKEAVLAKGLSPQQVIDRVNAQGGFGFLAHPFEKGMPFVEKSVAYTWNDLSVSGYTGISIWNFTSRWKERVRSPIHGLVLLLFKSQLLKGPSKRSLRFWDDSCQRRKVVAIGGSDAHGSEFTWKGITIRPFSYHYLLRSINIHILLSEPLSKDFNVAKQQVYDAMRKGNLCIAHDALARADGFRFYFKNESGEQCYGQGDEAGFKPGTFEIKLPRYAEVRLVRNGDEESRKRGKRVSIIAQRPGVYRVEAYLKVPLFGWRPWIFSNPIYLR